MSIHHQTVGRSVTAGGTAHPHVREHLNSSKAHTATYIHAQASIQHPEAVNQGNNTTTEWRLREDSCACGENPDPKEQSS